MVSRKPLTLTLEQESHQWCQAMAGTVIRARKLRRWSQRTLGAKVGLTQTQIAVLERDPDAAHIGRLYGTLRALGIELVMQPLAEGERPLRRRRSDGVPDAANASASALRA